MGEEGSAEDGSGNRADTVSVQTFRGTALRVHDVSAVP